MKGYVVCVYKNNIYYMDNILVVGSYAVAMFIKTPRMPIFGETLILE